MGFESHPGRPLRDHLREVAEGARARLDHPALAHRGLLREVAYLLGLAHDLGKYTPSFQNYLQGQGKQRPHAFLGAVFAAWLVWRRLPALPEAPGREFLPLLAYLAVHRHHGDLRSPKEILPRSRDLKGWPGLGRVSGPMRQALGEFQAQLGDLWQNRDPILRELEGLGLGAEARAFLGEGFSPLDLFQELDRLRYRSESLPEAEGARLGLWGQLLFSALVDADKFSAAGLSRIQRPDLPPDLVEGFLRGRHPRSQGPLDGLRARFQEEVRERVKGLRPGEVRGRVLSLTAPTGLGKTLAALDAALRLREGLKGLWGVPPRIVYALPFVNLIEQNHEVFHEVLEHGLGEAYRREPERFLLRHHHLAEVAYREGGEARPVAEALLLTESWESEVVVTTFVQVFQTLLGYRNRFLKRLHNLIGAILILDEVQALPVEYWSLVGRILEVLGRELGLVVLQMTATRPLIFPQAQELHPRPEALFRALSRTRMRVEEERGFPEWAGRILEIYEERGSLLVVVNTIRTSLRLYRWLRERVEAHPFGLEAPGSDPWLVYLSTNLVPRQRQGRLKALKAHLARGGRALLVSTQVVEAGVDLDFPAAVRELGPLDALIQVAGRGNRNGRLEEGLLYVLPLRDGGVERVYGAIHALVARRLLEGLQRGEVGEGEYARLVERYFQEVRGRISQEASEELWGAYCRLAYDNLGEEAALSGFHLIETPAQLPILVALTPEDEAWIQGVFKPEVLGEGDWARRREAYLRHRKRLHDLTLRPLLRRALGNLPPVLEGSWGLRWVPFGQLGDYYDPETGFRWEEGELDQAWMV